MIELKDVTAGYPFQPVFAHLSFAVPEGSFTGIVGPTGSGKTTLLRVALGLVPAASGDVLINGAPQSEQRPGFIGYVPQRGKTNTFFPATVEQSILMGLSAERRFPPWPTRDERRRAWVLAEKLGVTDCMNHHVSDISGGQQQRSFLARALIAEPRVLILDEPTAGVDMATQHTILSLLAELNRSGVTVVMTTHDLNGIAVHLPRVAFFNKAILAEGAPADVFTDEVLTATFGRELLVTRDGDRLIVTGSNPLQADG